MSLVYKNKKLIIFDLDGTLINSALDLALSINYMLSALGQDTFNEETIHKWVGNGALTLVKRALSGSRDEDENLDETHVKNALEIFLDYYEKNLCNKTVPYPNVVETLHALKNKGYTLAIVTNKPFAFVPTILKRLNIDYMFTCILGGDSLSKKKPDPMPLLHTCKTLKIDVKNSIMIGDSKNDILAANACGMESIGVTYGYNYGEDIGIYKPNIIIDDFSELLKYL